MEVKDLQVLAKLLMKARSYVEEPGSPGTIIETTKESAVMSAALLAEIDEALAKYARLGSYR